MWARGFVLASIADDDPAAKCKLALEVAEPFHIEGVMALSIIHVSKNTASALQLNSIDFIRYEHDQYGLLV